MYDSQLEISLKSALEINRAYEIGDTIREEVTPKDFGRIAAQTAKQVIMQRVRKEEREVIYNEYVQYEQEIVTGEVERRDNKFVYVNLGRIEAALSRQDQIPGEEYKSHDKIKVYIYKVENTSKGPQVFVSRSHPDLLRRLFEQEIPEIFDGTVEIVSISREAGDRAKVAFRNVSEKSDQKQGKDHTCDENDSSIAERLVCIAASFHKSAINDPTSAGHKVGTG